MTDITTHSGYLQRFWREVQERPESRHPMRDAHICVESELRTEHGLRRYSTYRSFSTAKTRHVKRANLKPAHR